MGFGLFGNFTFFSDNSLDFRVPLRGGCQLEFNGADGWLARGDLVSCWRGGERRSSRLVINTAPTPAEAGGSQDWLPHEQYRFGG